MRLAIGFRRCKKVNSRIVIIGAGPAGLSCALWLSNMGCHPILLERASQAGGMLRFNHHDNDWLLGFPRATGCSIKDRFMQHLHERNLSIVTSALPTSIVREGVGYGIAYTILGRRRQLNADFLVIASGTRPRAPIELESLAASFPDLFLVGAGELCIDRFVEGQHVAILGGGDNAFENAFHLASRGIEVDVYYRAKTSARHEWIARCDLLSNIRLHSDTITSQYAKVGNKVSFFANELPRQADVLAVMYGYQPNTETLIGMGPWLKPAINKEGFIKVNDYQQTVIPHLYAIGDVTSRPLPCLPSAIAQGSIAAKAIMLDAEGMLS